MRDEMQQPDPAETPDDLAALYAAGAMTREEQAQFESRLDANVDYRDALASFDQAAAALFAGVEPVAPNPSIRQILLRRIATESAAKSDSTATAPRIRRAATDRWRPTPIPGVTMRILHIDRPQRRFIALFRMEVGAVYPSHVHDQPEEILVLEGDLDFGDYVLDAGDYLRLEAGSNHAEARTRRGCVCLITAELPESLVA